MIFQVRVGVRGRVHLSPDANGMWVRHAHIGPLLNVVKTLQPAPTTTRARADLMRETKRRQTNEHRDPFFHISMCVDRARRQRSTS